MPIEFHGQIRFPAGDIRVVLESDFFHNSFSVDPYPHSHPKYELHYILQGNCTLIQNAVRLSCPQGHFLLLPPHCVHRLTPDQEGVQTMSFLFSATGLDGGVPPVVSGCTYPLLLEDSFDGEERLMRIRQELRRKGASYCEMIQGELTCLFADISRACGNETAANEADPDENRAERIEDYLVRHRFDPDCSCSALARELNLSTRQVHRLCLQYFNASFRELVVRMRMEIAAHRLQTSAVSVTDLAAELGYASTASFSAAYKRHFGIAPTKERV